MGRKKNPNRAKAREIFLKAHGKVKLADIAEKLGVSPSAVRKWKSQENWDDMLTGKKERKESVSKTKGSAPKKKDVLPVKVEERSAYELETFEVEELLSDCGLTDKEQMVALTWLKTRNITQSGLKAGFSKKCAYHKAKAILQKEHVEKFICALKHTLTEGMVDEINLILEKQFAIAFGDVTNYVKFGRKEVPVIGAFGPVKDEDDNQIYREINYIDLKESSEVDGQLIKKVSIDRTGNANVELHDPKQAMETILKFMDALGERGHKRWLDKERLQLEKDKITGIDKAAIESWDRLCDLLGSKFEQFKDGRGESTIQWAPFSDVHVEYIHDTFENTINVAEGAVRAGKTIDNVIAFAMGLEKSRDKIHLVSAATVGTAKLNIGVSNGFGLEALFRGRCHWGKYRDNEALYITTRDHEEKVVIFVGAGKADSFKRIRGNSYGMWLATEINIHHPDFIKEAFNRQLAAIDRRVYWDLNPEQPEHDIYTLYIDNYQAKQEAGTMVGGYNYKHFTIFDNMSISDERKQEIISQYDPESIWYKRDILGQRLHVEGLIYEMDNVEWIDYEELDKSRVTLIDIAIDGGYQKSATTFSGYGYYQMPVGELPKIVVCDTYYFEPTEKEKKAPSEFSVDLHKFCEELSLMYDAAVDDQTIDSAEGALRTQYEKDYGIRLNPVAKIAKEDMIAFAFDLLKSGRVMIVRTEGNEKWYQEHRFYRWDPKKEKEPVKERDHTCDQFQYYILENMRKLGIR